MSLMQMSVTGSCLIAAIAVFRCLFFRRLPKRTLVWLWIAAALGEDRDLIIRTAEEIKEYETYRAKCGVIRRAIPWKRIYELALPLVEEERNKKVRRAG